jgi:hypothetical protein
MKHLPLAPLSAGLFLRLRAARPVMVWKSSYRRLLESGTRKPGPKEWEVRAPTREAAMAAFAKSWRRQRKAWKGRLAARFRTIQVCPKDSPATLGEDRRWKLIDGIIAFGGGFPWL